jgi:hypothetical protein
MHIEKNFFDNIFNTVMDVQGKTKDNEKARKDVELYCNQFFLGFSAVWCWLGSVGFVPVSGLFMI